MDEDALIARYVEPALSHWGSDEAHVIEDDPLLWILVRDLTTAQDSVLGIASAGSLARNAAYPRVRALSGRGAHVVTAAPYKPAPATLAVPPECAAPLP